MFTHEKYVTGSNYEPL